MDVKLIAFSMTAILVGLFIFARYYAPREKKKMLLEGNYFTSVRDLKNQPENSELRQKAEVAARNYALALGMSDNEAQIMLEKDLL